MTVLQLHVYTRFKFLYNVFDTMKHFFYNQSNCSSHTGKLFTLTFSDLLKPFISSPSGLNWSRCPFAMMCTPSLCLCLALDEIFFYTRQNKQTVTVKYKLDILSKVNDCSNWWEPMNGNTKQTVTKHGRHAGKSAISTYTHHQKVYILCVHTP